MVYIKYNNTLGLNYYDEINYAPLSDLLRQASIKTENKLMVFSDSIWKDCPDTGRGIGACVIFIKLFQLNMAHMFHYQFLN